MEKSTQNNFHEWLLMIQSVYYHEADAIIIDKIDTKK